jgi:hypothetical protein
MEAISNEIQEHIFDNTILEKAVSDCLIRY